MAMPLTHPAHLCARCARCARLPRARALAVSRESVAAREHAFTSRAFSVLARPPPNYPGHVPLTVPERILLGAGSAVLSLLNPRRAGNLPSRPQGKGTMAEPATVADLIAACGEATCVPFFIYRLRDAMLADPTGRRILRDRPRITSASLDLVRLRALPDGAVGREYVRWLDREAVSPDTRSPVVLPSPSCRLPRHAAPL